MDNSQQMSRVNELTESERKRKEVVEAGGTVVANMDFDDNLIRWAQNNNRYQRIDCRTDWCNPFILNKDGDRDAICDSFSVYLDSKPSLLERIDELRGKVLGCWCYPERCHGDEIIKRLKA